MLAIWVAGVISATQASPDATEFELIHRECVAKLREEFARARRDPESFHISYSLRRSSSYTPAELQDRWGLSGQLHDEVHSFSVNGSRWHASYRSWGPDSELLREQEVSFDGECLTFVTGGVVTVILDPAAIEEHLLPVSRLFHSGGFFDAVGLRVPDTRARLGAPLAPALVDELRDGRVERCSTSAFVELEVLEVPGTRRSYRLDPGKGFALLETRLTRNERLVETVECRSFERIGTSWLPRLVERRRYTGRTVPSDVAPAPVVVETFAVSELRAIDPSSTPAVEHAQGIMVADARQRSAPTAHDGFLQYIEPMDAELVLAAFTEALEDSSAQQLGRNQRGGLVPWVLVHVVVLLVLSAVAIWRRFLQAYPADESVK